MAVTQTAGDSLSARSQRSDQLTKGLALAGVFGPVVYLLTIAIAGLLRPGYSPIHQAASDLGVGQNAWLLNGAGILNFLLLMAWLVAFWRRSRTVLTPGWRRLSTALLALPPLGFAVASIFTEAPATVTVHWMVGANLGLLGPIVAFAVTGVALRQHHRWRAWGNYTLLASLATAIIVGITFFVFAPHTPIASAKLGGIMERVAIIEILAWYVIAGWLLAREIEIDR